MLDKTYLSEIRNDIYSGRIKNAMEKIKTCSAMVSDWHAIDTLNHYEGFYKGMCQYMQTGIPDPERVTIFSGLAVTLLDLTDKLIYNMGLKDDPARYYTTARNLSVSKTTIEGALKKAESLQLSVSNTLEFGGVPNDKLLNERDKAVEDLFNSVWTARVLTDEQHKAMADVILNPAGDKLLSLVMISALTLGLLYFYDAKKIDILLRAAEDASLAPEIQARAVVGLVCAIRIHVRHIAFDVKMVSRLKTIADNSRLTDLVRHTVMEFIKARDTDRLNNVIKKDIFPKLQRLQPKFLNNPFNAESIDDLVNPEANPEWQGKLDDFKNEIGKEIMKINEWHEQGGDVMATAFSELKKFPFFQYASNWFLPFDTNCTSLANLRKDNSEVLDYLTDASGVLCDSDLYSLGLLMDSQQSLLASMGNSGGKMMLEQLKMQLSGFKEMNAEMEKDGSPANADKVKNGITLYMRNLYRFFRLYPYRKEMKDIFGSFINPFSLPLPTSVVATDDNLISFAEFYLGKGYYPEALQLFLRMVPQLKSPAVRESVFQKIGFCFQHLQDLEKALEYYEKAELINPDNAWLVKRLAITHKALGHYEKAAYYYKRALQNEPENLSLLLSTGNAYLDSGEYEKALKAYYKVDYLSGGSVKTWRPIAWCNFMMDNYDRSNDYYNKILASNEANAQDYLNAGHLAIAMNNYPEAIRRYRLSADLNPKKTEGLIAALEADVNYLEKIGLQKTDRIILFDSLRYQQDNK